MKRISFANQLVLLWALIAVVCTLLAGVIWSVRQHTLEPAPAAAKEAPAH